MRVDFKSTCIDAWKAGLAIFTHLSLSRKRMRSGECNSFSKVTVTSDFGNYIPHFSLSSTQEKFLHNKLNLTVSTTAILLYSLF